MLTYASDINSQIMEMIEARTLGLYTQQTISYGTTQIVTEDVLREEGFVAGDVVVVIQEEDEEYKEGLYLLKIDSIHGHEYPMVTVTEDQIESLRLQDYGAILYNDLEEVVHEKDLVYTERYSLYKIFKGEVLTQPESLREENKVLGIYWDAEQNKVAVTVYQVHSEKRKEKEYSYYLELEELMVDKDVREPIEVDMVIPVLQYVG